MIEESYFDDLDRKFLNASSQITNFFGSQIYGLLRYRLVAPLDPDQFDNATTRTKEIGIRILIVLGTILGLGLAGSYALLAVAPLAVASAVFRSLGLYFQKNGFTHIRGSAPEIKLTKDQASVMTWNIRGEAPYTYGLTEWRSRIDKIIANIRAENPDIVVLQDVSDTALMETLIRELDYAHFYTHLGLGTSGSESGCMVMTKCAVHHFSYTGFKNTKSYEIDRHGFGVLEVKASPEEEFPCARIIGTQLTSGKESEETRIDQVTQVIQTLSKQKLALPTFFVGGSLSKDPNTEEGKFFSQHFYHSYRGEEPTHSSDRLRNQWAPVSEKPEESNDFIAFFKRNSWDGKILPVIEKNIRFIESHLVKGFEEDYSTQTACSDRHAVVTIFSGISSK